MIFAIWHIGQQHVWVFVGKNPELGATFNEAAQSQDFLDYQNRGHLLTYLRDHQVWFQDDAVTFLCETLESKAKNLVAKTTDRVDMAAIFPTGMAPRALEVRCSEIG